MAELEQTAGGVGRAAILLMALGEEYAAEILKHMEPRELHKIGAAMAGLSKVTREQVGEVLSAFNAEVEAQTSMGVDSKDYIRTVMVRALGRDKAKPVLEQVLNGDTASGVDTLKWMDADAIARGLRNEHPQVVALVLSYLTSEQSAQVLSLLPEDLRFDAVVRVAKLEGVTTGALTELNELIEKQVVSTISASTTSKVGGAKRAAEILNLVGSGIDEQILERIKSTDETLATEIEDLMVVFDHLLDVDDLGIQTLLREVSTEVLMVALRGCDESVREKILNNMSKRAAEMLRDDLEVMPPVRLSDVESAQKEILSVAKRLAESGEISLGSKGGDALV